MAQKTVQQAFDLVAAELDALGAAVAAVDTAEFAGPFANTAAIPTPYDTNDLYLVGAAAPYKIYAAVNSGGSLTLVELGNTNVDLTGYYTKPETDAAIAAAVPTASTLMVNWR